MVAWRVVGSGQGDQQAVEGGCQFEASGFGRCLAAEFAQVDGGINPATGKRIRITSEHATREQVLRTRQTS